MAHRQPTASNGPFNPADYAAYLKGKSCILVGPAAYLKGQGRGAWIDSFDVVIKMNWGETLSPSDYGRTDVLYKRLLKLGHADEILIDEYVAAGIKWLIAVDHPLSRYTPYLQKVIGARVPWFVEGQTRREVTRELGNSALLGPISVRDILKHKVKSLTMTGCDFYLTGYAAEYGGKVYRSYMRRREGVIGPTHDGVKQLAWLDVQRRKDSRLSFDAELDKLARTPGLLPARTPKTKPVPVIPAGRKRPAPKAAAVAPPVAGVTVIIPARYESSRFPGKPLAPILGKPMVLHVCERVASLGVGVVVATDDPRIATVVQDAGYKAVITSMALTGTDRVAQAVAQFKRSAKPGNIYVNVQGDEPLIDPQAILAVIALKRKYRFEVVNAMTRLQEGEAESRDVVKAVVRKGGLLAYCSRAPVPAGREAHTAKWKQLGLYAFNLTELQKFADYGKRSPLEEGEDVEILRFLDLGINVRMQEVPAGSQAVDRPEDIAKVEALMQA